MRGIGLNIKYEKEKFFIIERPDSLEVFSSWNHNEVDSQKTFYSKDFFR